MNRAVFASLLVLAAASAQAQFKVVGPDGRITYTDRPPPATEGRAAPAKGPSGADRVAAVPAPPLPVALREPSTRFPVTLYSAPECAPCDAGRDLLRQRGVPFQERIASSAGDREAWVRIVGSADAPALAIGGQWLRGFAAGLWHSYLDTAGYPRQSQLPTGYVAPPPAPLVERVTPKAPEPPPPPPPAEVPPPTDEPGGIRF
jgi:glutaredoxin